MCVSPIIRFVNLTSVFRAGEEERPPYGTLEERLFSEEGDELLRVAGPAEGKEAGARTACKDDSLHGGGTPDECAKTHILFCGNRLSGFLFVAPADLREGWLFPGNSARGGCIRGFWLRNNHSFRLVQEREIRRPGDQVIDPPPMPDPELRYFLCPNFPDLRHRTIPRIPHPRAPLHLIVRRPPPLFVHPVLTRKPRRDQVRHHQHLLPRVDRYMPISWRDKYELSRSRRDRHHI